MKIAYLHGLESSIDPKDEKIIWLNNNFDQVYTPSIDYKNKGSFNTILRTIKNMDPHYIVGSSMGGYFAYLIGSKLGIKTVLFNPAVIDRSFEPVVDDTGLGGRSGHNLFLGKNDKVIDGNKVRKFFSDSGMANFSTEYYDGGHRVPASVFIDAIKKVSGVSEIYNIQNNNKIMNRFEEFMNEKREDVGKYNTVKKVVAKLGRRPSEQELAKFITDNYYDVTEVEREDNDPRADDKIADLVAFYKFDIDDWEIAWEDAQNESVVVENIKVGSVIPIKKYIPTKNSYQLVDVRVTDYIKKPGSKDFVEYEFKGKKIKVAINIFKRIMESVVTEATDINDPVLMAFRAAKMKREKELAKPKRKPLYGKQRQKAEDQLWDISQDLKDLYADRGQLLIDMEQEAEAEGGPVADRFGSELMDIENKIQELIAKRSKLEMRLAESKGHSTQLNRINESVVTEAKMPNKLIGNDEIVFLKTKEDSKGANYNLYYKGHDIEKGGVRFGSEKELKAFADNYILSNQLYNKLKYEDSKPLPESFLNESEIVYHKYDFEGMWAQKLGMTREEYVAHFASMNIGVDEAVAKDYTGTQFEVKGISFVYTDTGRFYGAFIYDVPKTANVNKRTKFSLSEITEFLTSNGIKNKVPLRYEEKELESICKKLTKKGIVCDFDDSMDVS
jgi:hypothetical protein